MLPYLPHVLMIGAAGRNVGKTEFACAVIRRVSQVRPIAAVKITAIREDSPCPRGTKSCGVCGSLHGKPFEITEETGGNPGKDTFRLREARAAKVLWLRVRQSNLAEGVAALFAALPAGMPVVCECNSARAVMEPAVFLVIRDPRNGQMKESCREVITQADRVVAFDGTGWDLPPEDLVFHSNRWWLRQDAAAIVLAGGKSSRMGTDKSLLPYHGGTPLIQHITDQLRPLFREVLIGANNAEAFQFLNLPVVPDRMPDQGPLMGLLSCLEHSTHELHFLTACDIPELPAETIMQLLAAATDVDAVVPFTEGGNEPLFAVYRKSAVLPAAETALANGKRRIADMFEHIRLRRMPLSDSTWLRNLNTPEDYHSERQKVAP